MSERTHSAGACSYGWDAEYTLRLTAACGANAAPAVLQEAVLAQMGHGDESADAHSQQVSRYAQAIIARLHRPEASHAASSGAATSCSGSASASGAAAGGSGSDGHAGSAAALLS